MLLLLMIEQPCTLQLPQMVAKIARIGFMSTSWYATYKYQAGINCAHNHVKTTSGHKGSLEWTQVEIRSDQWKMEKERIEMHTHIPLAIYRLSTQLEK